MMPGGASMSTAGSFRSRRFSRELALQVLFQLDIHGSPGYWLEDFWTRQPIPDEVRLRTESLIEGVREHRREIDSLISRSALHWKLSRMSVIDRNILRMALYELIWEPDVPAKVSVNEAIELAKRFADDEARRFVNGILDHVLKTDPRLHGKRQDITQGAAVGKEPSS